MADTVPVPRLCRVPLCSVTSFIINQVLAQRLEIYLRPIGLLRVHFAQKRRPPATGEGHPPRDGKGEGIQKHRNFLQQCRRAAARNLPTEGLPA